MRLAIIPLLIVLAGCDPNPGLCQNTGETGLMEVCTARTFRGMCSHTEWKAAVKLQCDGQVKLVSPDALPKDAQ